jgi:hypothetical protein
MNLRYDGAVLEVPAKGTRVVNYEGKWGTVYGIDRSQEGKPIVMVNMDSGGARWFLPHHVAWHGEDEDQRKGCPCCVCYLDRGCCICPRRMRT